MEAAQIFRRAVKGKNIITPTIRGYEFAGGFVVEMSKGEAMDGGTLYGVTVVDRFDITHRHELSKVFPNSTLARKYVDKLKQM